MVLEWRKRFRRARCWLIRSDWSGLLNHLVGSRQEWKHCRCSAPQIKDEHTHHTHTHTALRTDLCFSLSCNSDCSSQPMTQVYLWLSSFSPSTNINTVFSGNCWQLWRSHRVKKQKIYRVKKEKAEIHLKEWWKKCEKDKREEVWDPLWGTKQVYFCTDLSSKQIMSNYNTFHCL